MLSKYKRWIIHFLFRFILHLILINNISSLCDKSTPYLKDNNCVSYSSCSDISSPIEDIGECEIDNPIVKTQFLSNIIQIGVLNFRYLNYAFNLNGDLIILSSSIPASGIRVFFGLKKNGRFFFNNENKEYPSYSIEVKGEVNEDQRKYEAETFFIQLSSDNNDINNKEYLLSIAKWEAYTELFNLKEKTYKTKKTSDFFDYFIYCRVFSFFKLNGSTGKNYYIIGGIIKIDNLFKFVIKKLSFSSEELYNGYTTHNYHEILVSERKMSSCFETEKFLIICFLVDLNGNYIVIVYNQNLEYQSKNYIMNKSKGLYDEELFYKGIHFKGEIGIFAFYLSYSETNPIICFKKFESSYAMSDYNNLVNLRLEKITSSYNVMYNDIMKLNNFTICFFSVNNEREKFYIVLLKLYGDSYSYLVKRYYTVNIYELYNYKFYNDLRIFSYNNFTSLISSYCIEGECNSDNDPHNASLIIFSYANSTDYDFNLTNYLLNNNNFNISDLCFTLENNIKIENNIFGLIFDGIQILNISNDIKLESCLNNKSITIDYILQKGEYFRIYLNNIKEQNHIIEYALIVTEPSYNDTLNLLSSSGNGYNENEKDYNNFKSKYIGKTSYFNIINQISTDCYDKLCEYCMSTDNKKCVKCKQQGYLDINNKICFSNDTSDRPSLIVTTPIVTTPIVTTLIITTPIVTTPIPIPSTFSYYECSNEIILNGKCQEKIYDQQIKDIHGIITNQILNGDFQNKTNKIIYTKNVIFQVTLYEYQKLANILNVSSVDLGECEKRLKDKEGLSEDSNLTIFKIDIKNEDFSSTYVQYEIYNNNTLKKLDLDICNDLLITIKAPAVLDNNIESLYNELNELGYNLFKSNDSFYNDICSTYTSENGTDVLLSDRRRYLYKNNSLCQENCEFQSYNSTNKKVLCECSVKENKFLTYAKKTKFSQEIILDSFYTTWTNSNFKIMKCFKLVFSLKGYADNIGNHIMSIIIFIMILITIIYCVNDYKKIKKYINQIVKSKLRDLQYKNNARNSLQKSKSLFKNKKNEIKEKEDEKDKDDIKTTRNNLKKPKNNKIVNFSNIIIEENTKKEKNPPKKLKNIISIKKKKNDYKNLSNTNLPHTKSNIQFLRNSQISVATEVKIKRSNKKHRTFVKPVQKKFVRRNWKALSVRLDNSIKIKDIRKHKDIKLKMKLNDEELNSLNYEEAIEIDKRTFFQYYISLIKKKQLFLFTFLPANDYNLITIKISLFLISFSLYFVINGFFFSDGTMHKIFLDNGSYIFIYQVPQILYSSVISLTINILLKLLSLSESTILKLKKYQDININNIISRGKETEKELKKKFIISFILHFLLMFFFWYYISCFCAVYNNTQMILIKDTLISFGFSNLYPFGIYLLPGIFRIPSLKAKNKDKKIFYQIGSTIALI